MIGNDLVYIPGWKRRSGDRLKRFRQKIYTQQEIAWIEAAEDPFLLEAKFWTVKEAVYKSWFKQSRNRVFNPKKIVIESFDEVEGKLDFQVNLENFGFRSVCRHHGDFIHAVAMEFDEVFEFQSYQQIDKPKVEAVPFEGSKILLNRDSAGVPFGLLEGRKLDLSKSHDGRQLAVVWRD